MKSAPLFAACCIVLFVSLRPHCWSVARADDSNEASAGQPVVFSDGFESSDARASWHGIGGAGCDLVTLPGGASDDSPSPPQVVFVEASGSTPTTRMIRRPLDLTRLRGTRVVVSGRVKAERVAQPANAWNGIKVMLHVTSPSGQTWRQRNSVFGTFDWKTVAFVAEVPDDATSAELALGLEETTGRAWFDDVAIKVVARRRRVPTERPAKIADDRCPVPRLRGVMSGRNMGPADVRELGRDWNANHIRWQLNWGGFPHGPADKATVAEYRHWLEAQLEHIDALLPVCKEVGVYLVIDMHTPPGGRNESRECRMFHDARFQQAFLDAWDDIARRYQGEEAVWGYDLVNEPVEGVLPPDLMDWRTLAEVCARRVRAIDPAHAIIVEPGPWGSPAGLDWFEPIDVPGIVYSVHMYLPHAFTHQGVRGTETGITYPGEIDGETWNKDALRRALGPAIRYQRDYGVPIYIGEFSAIRWAPGDSAHDYLQDCLDIFEEHQWHAAYHAFREYHGWSVEHGADPKNTQPVDQPTTREQLLRRWFAKNEH